MHPNFPFNYYYCLDISNDVYAFSWCSIKMICPDEPPCFFRGRFEEPVETGANFDAKPGRALQHGKQLKLERQKKLPTHQNVNGTRSAYRRRIVG